MLQADSEDQCQAWIQAIQAGVSKAYMARPSTDGLVRTSHDVSYCEL